MLKKLQRINSIFKEAEKSYNINYNTKKANIFNLHHIIKKDIHTIKTAWRIYNENYRRTL